MTLSQQQKALAENIIMVVEELTAQWSREDREPYNFNYMILDAFERVNNMLRHKKARSLQGIPRGIPFISEVIGKEVRRARSYKDMAAEEIIEALNVALEILKKDD